MIRAVLFDLGHTVWDIEPGDGSLLDKAYSAMRATMCERLGRGDLPQAAELRQAVTAALQADNETYFGNGQMLEQPPSHYWVDAGCRSLGIECDEHLLSEVTPPLFATEIDRLIVQAGTIEAIHKLEGAGLRLGCITNTLANEAAIRAMLRTHELEQSMGSVVVSSEEGFRKPHPTLFEKAMRQLDVSPKDCVFVGDSPYHDIGGAKSLGMNAVLTTQYVRRPWIAGVPAPDAKIAHLRELPAALAALSSAT